MIGALTTVSLVRDENNLLLLLLLLLSLFFWLLLLLTWIKGFRTTRDVVVEEVVILRVLMGGIVDPPTRRPPASNEDCETRGRFSILGETITVCTTLFIVVVVQNALSNCQTRKAKAPFVLCLSEASSNRGPVLIHRRNAVPGNSPPGNLARLQNLPY